MRLFIRRFLDWFWCEWFVILGWLSDDHDSA